MEDKKTQKKQTPSPPQMSPYVFTFLLLGFGLWCFWDGWLTTDPEMAEHALFNQVLSAVLIPWGIWDFFKVKKSKKNNNRATDTRGCTTTDER
ncbi:hypothetical protein [uncultured Desulfobacter sp.]|uniref:hypothetical protein n=1 Tax=uncultured Desulfobacter sp. TaxID=240139 RepID=UPI002AABF839|nr:hypothetical protein [uncultured Desulfobacter sp.]